MYGKGGTLDIFAGKEISKNLFQSPLDPFVSKNKPANPDKPVNLPKIIFASLSALLNDDVVRDDGKED